MKKFMCMLVVLGAVAVVNADMVLDNFESYANSAALQSKWVKDPASNAVNVTLESVLNGKCLLLENNSNSPYYGQVQYFLPGAVQNDHGVNLAYAGFTALKMTFAIPLNNGVAPWGYLGGSGGDLYVSMFDCYGYKVFTASYPGTVTPSGTGWPTGTVWTLDTTNIVAGMNLQNVARINIGVNATYYGQGGLFIDDITLVGVPEPATMAVLSLGGLLLRKRK